MEFEGAAIAPAEMVGPERRDACDDDAFVPPTIVLVGSGVRRSRPSALSHRALIEEERAGEPRSDKMHIGATALHLRLLLIS